MHPYSTELKASKVSDDSESACGRACLLDLHVSTINDGRAQADGDLEERMSIDWKVEVGELRRRRPRFSDSGDVEARRQAHLPDAGSTTDSLEGD